jgi:hypothetical protein
MLGPNEVQGKQLPFRTWAVLVCGDWAALLASRRLEPTAQDWLAWADGGMRHQADKAVQMRRGGATAAADGCAANSTDGWMGPHFDAERPPKSPWAGQSQWITKQNMLPSQRFRLMFS